MTALIKERTIALSTIGVTICWLVGITLAVANIFVSYDVGTLGVAFIAVAATINIRGSFERHMKNWTTAYEVGKEAGLRRIPKRD